jgi:drug/metabolite transporter (DMT)-like permease
MTTSTYTKPDLLSWGYFLFLSLTWGSSFILIKRGLEGFTVWQSATIRIVVAAIILVGFAARHIHKIPKGKLKYIFLSSMMGMFAPSYLFCAAEVNLSSSVTGVLNALTPAFAAIVGFIFFKKSLQRFQSVGIIIGFIGTACLVLINANSKIEINGYAFLVMLAASFYGININIVKNHLADINPFHLTTVAVSFSGALGLIVLFATGYESYVNIQPQQISPLIALATLGIMGTALAQIALNKLIKRTSVVFASSNTYIIPIVAVVWGIADGEQLHFWHFVGMSAIILGILVLNGKITLPVKKKSSSLAESL